MSKITFSEVSEADFEDFKTLRKFVMYEHVERQGLPWDEEREDKYHRELFDTPGLRKILLDENCIGYIGLEEKGDHLDVGRFCIRPELQKKGIGSEILTIIMQEPETIDRTIRASTLKVNPSQHLCERFGCILVGEDEKLLHFERPPRNQLNQKVP